MTVHTINGYRFHQLYNTGLGVGLDRYGTITSLPLYLSVRRDLFASRVTPMFNANVGYGWMWESDSYNEWDDFDNPSTFSDGTRIALDVSNITDEYKTAHPDSILVYDFVEGDRVRFIRTAQGNLFSEYFDLKILSFSAGVVKVENLVSLGKLEAGVLFELYTPKLDVETQIFYEIGECFEVGDSGLSIDGRRFGVLVWIHSEN